MVKLLSLRIVATLLFALVIIDVQAIPTRDRQAIIEKLNAYGLGVLDHYPSREPSTADGYCKLGVAYLFWNVPQAAAEQFRKALELDPSHIDSLIGLSATTAQMGDVATALEHAKKALDIESNNAKVHNLMGALNLANANSVKCLEEAETSFKKAILLDSNLTASRMNLARLYVSMRKSGAAVKQYEAVIEIQPENLTAHAELARAYLITGSLDKATEEAEKTAELSPQSPVSHNILGEMYTRNRQLDKALEEFHKAAELEPTYATAYNNIGHILFLKGLPDKAIEQFNEAISYNPNYAEAYSNLGEVYITKGMYQEAVERYKKAIEVLPVSALISVPVYNNLAYIYAEEGGNLDKALSYAQRAAELVPKDPDVADTIGWIYYKKGNYDEAVDNLRVAVEGSPDNPIIRYHLGAVYYHKGAKEEAARELSKALSISDKFEGAEDARHLLAGMDFDGEKR